MSSSTFLAVSVPCALLSLRTKWQRLLGLLRRPPPLSIFNVVDVLSMSRVFHSRADDGTVEAPLVAQRVPRPLPQSTAAIPSVPAAGDRPRLLGAY